METEDGNRPPESRRSAGEEGTAGNRVVLLDEGETLFDLTLEAIRRARDRVWIETFLFMPDRTGRAVLDALAEAAARGCDVVLLFDQLGSPVTSLGFYRKVQDAGGTVGIFNPLPPWRRLGSRLGPWLKHRDHRKVVVIDDVGFCGGHNFSAAYMGPPPHRFYDMTLQLEGPAVRELGGLFLESLERTTGETRALPPAGAAAPGGAAVRVLGHDGTRGGSELSEAYARILDGASHRVVLVMAYFIPDQPLREPILRAARRGVQVDLLTTGSTDLPPARWAGQHTYTSLLRAGVRIHELKDPKLHAKAMAVDGELALVGSFDINTFERQNTAEVAVLVRNPRIATAIERGFRSSLPRSEQVTASDWAARSRLRRPLERLSYRLLDR
jgi:cardiolipin synthase A/B